MENCEHVWGIDGVHTNEYCKRCFINKPLTIGQRWERGIPHDPRSKEIYKAIAKIDFEENGDYFNFKSGGDGDNGEELMYLLDIYFQDKPIGTL